MPVCNISKRKALFSAAFLLGSAFLCAQTMPKMPEMPDISDMPEITPVEMGSGFYRPQIPYYPKNKNKAASQDDKTSSTETAKNETTLSDGSTTQTLLNSLLGNTDFLTAQDITSLSDSGSFSTLSSLYNSTLTSTTDSASTNTLLRQILSELEELKKNTPKETAASAGSDTFKSHNPQILRFKINGYDIKDSLTTVYFSQMENDGSFLLTADRRYVADKKIRNETFYFLFKTESNTGSMVTYEVCPSLTQDDTNENSFLYKLSRQKKITATKTGNLVIMHVDNKECSADLLLDLDI